MNEGSNLIPLNSRGLKQKDRKQMKKIILITLVVTSLASNATVSNKLSDVNKTYAITTDLYGTDYLTIYKKSCSKGICLFTYGIHDSSFTWFSIDDAIGYKKGKYIFFTDHISDGHLAYVANIKTGELSVIHHGNTATWFYIEGGNGFIRSTR